MSNVDNTGVVNPYALVETLAGRPFDWDRIVDPQRILEEILETPYEELFDPKYNSPLYPGLRLTSDLELEPVPFSELKLRGAGRQVNDQVIERLQTVEDLLEYLHENREAGINIRDLHLLPTGILTVDLDIQSIKSDRLTNLVLPELVAHLIVNKDFGKKKKKTDEWNPDHIKWEDPGHFFNKAADFWDPRQGSLSNCYFVAALGSVAWARPYDIMHRTRSIGPEQEEFTCMIRYHRAGSISDKNKETTNVEVTEKLPLHVTTNGFVYCRSTEPGEIWPGVYEKAFAKWITGVTSDKPDITATGGGGNAVQVMRQLTGLSQAIVLQTKDATDDQVWDFLLENCFGSKTIHPMIASTYASADAAQEANGKKISYGDPNLVAWHAYSVLGCARQSRKRYIVLRNPWAVAHNTEYTLTGDWIKHHVDWWKSTTLGTKGVFAIEISTFRTYFRRIAVVK